MGVVDKYFYHMESAGRCLQNTKGGVREGLMEEAAFERNLKDVLGSGVAWGCIRKKAVPGRERALAEAQSCEDGAPTLPVCEMPHSWLSPKALATLALASSHLPGPMGTCPVTPPFLLGALSLSFSDIKTRKLALVLDFNGADVLPFYSDVLVQLEMMAFLL